MAITAEIQKQPQSRIKLDISVDNEEVRSAFQKTYQNVAKKAHLKGFRPGKVPVGVVKMRFGSTIAREVTENLMQEALTEAVKQHSLRPLGNGDLIGDFPEITEADKLSFAMEIDVFPEFELPEYKGVAVSKDSYEVKDEDLEAELARISDRFTSFEDKAEGAIEAEDLAILDYEVIHEGEAVEKLTRTRYAYDLKVGASFPDFQDGLRGKNIDDEFEIPGKVPENFPLAELAGKDVIFKGKVLKIQKRVPPSFDDEFAAKVSDKKTFEEFRATLKEDMQAYARKQESDQVKQKLLDSLIDKTEIELPKALVENQLEGMLEELAGTLARMGTSVEDYLKQTGKTIQQVHEDYLPAAERAAIAYALLSEISTTEKIEANQDDINETLTQMARYYGQDREQLREAFTDNGEINSIVWRIVRSKTLDFLEENAEISIEKTLPFSELPKE